jgi:hypothetical protein
MSGTSRCSAAYSTLARIARSVMLPAARTTKRSPSPAWNTTSGGTRESAHERIVAKGV